MQPVDLLDKNKLRPCPFCQGKAFLYTNEQDGITYFVGCIDELNRCTVISSTKGDKTEAEAIKHWNERKTIIVN